MAKLSAYGRTELFRLEREQHISPEQVGEDGTTWRRHTVAVMSDRTILEKHDFAYRTTGDCEVKVPGTFKVRGKMSDKVTPEQYKTNMLTPCKGESCTWRVAR